jgi:hypothetical protein
MRRQGVVLLALLLVGGCAAPALRTYVLGAPNALAGAYPAQPVSDTVIELRPVLLPEHLDSHEILRRDGPVLVASRNGRWAERLSVGMRQALVADLQARLPQDAIVAASPLTSAFRRVDLTVDGFDLDAGGTLTLAASWVVESVPSGGLLARRRIRMAATGIATGDPAQVAAMGGLLDQLAAAIARDL